MSVNTIPSYRNDNLRNCSFIKTVLMLSVMFGHAVAFWSGNWFDVESPIIESIGLKTLYSWVNSFHVYGFALISGYLFAFKILQGGYSAYIPFILNKVKRLLIPYVFSMLVWVAPISQLFFKWDASYLIKKYILCINPSQLWFLWMLFWVFAIFWPLREIMKQRPTFSWVISATLYVIGLICSRFLPNVFCIWTACRYVLFFNLGFRIRIKQEKSHKPIIYFIPWYTWFVFDVIVFVARIKVDAMTGTIWLLMRFGLSFTLNIVGAIMAWTSLQELAAHFNHWQQSKAFAILFSYSMPMYLFHQQFIYFSIVWLNGKIAPWLHSGVNFIVAIIGSFLISSVLMQWKQTRFLIGEK